MLVRRGHVVRVRVMAWESRGRSGRLQRHCLGRGRLWRDGPGRDRSRWDGPGRRALRRNLVGLAAAARDEERSDCPDERDQDDDPEEVAAARVLDREGAADGKASGSAWGSGSAMPRRPLRRRPGSPLLGLPLVMTGTPSMLRQDSVSFTTSAVTTKSLAGVISEIAYGMAKGTGRPCGASWSRCRVSGRSTGRSGWRPSRHRSPARVRSR